jgi:hypothetical protein
MRPLNLDNSPCTPTSSNCVIWGGPNIPCIKLCTGDTISDVVFKLATELCTLLDQTNVTIYDLACFNLAACPPTTFDQLIQLLIDKICALENITPTTTTTSTTSPGKSTTSSALVSDYLLTAAPCLGGGTIGLVDYVNLIAFRICDLITELTIITASINSLDIRVTALETAPTPTFIIPSFTLQCDIGTIIPVLAAGSTQDIDIVLQRFINEEWCPYKAVFGTSTNLSNAISSQCIAGTDPALATQFVTPGVQMNVQYPTYVGTPTTLNQAISNIWLALCDVRNAGKEEVTLTAGDNVTITPTVTVVGFNQVTDYLIDAKDTVVVAGDNITVTPAGPVAGVTTYTIIGKEAIVAAGTGITVTPVTVGNDTTYTVTATPFGGMLASGTPPGIPKVVPGLNTSRLSDAPIFIPAVVYDDDTAYNAGTGVWTCPATGRYNVSFRIHLTQPAGTGWYDVAVPGILVAGLMGATSPEYYVINSYTPAVIQKHADISSSLIGYSFTAGDTLCLKIMNTTNFDYLSTVGDVVEFSVQRIK